MEIVVEYKSTVLGPGVFWRGPAERVGEIHNIPARETARLVAKDGKPRVCGMWHVSAEEQYPDEAHTGEAGDEGLKGK